ncbi:MAG: hypothetical protein ACPG8V_03060 [Alphaproteobacteria bacterium]
MKKTLLILSIIALAGCSARQVGQIAGGSLGGYAGSKLGKDVAGEIGQVVGTGVGAYLGSEFGGRVFDQLSESSQNQMTSNMNEVLETGVDGDVGKWENHADNSSGEFEVENTQYVEELKTTCRNFTNKVSHNGKQETVKGRACRNADGTWRYES